MDRPAMRPLIFGEVLFDHFPDGTAVLGGAPFNVAWHLHAFGLRPLMISRIGDDELGRKVEHAMLDWGMDCSGMQVDSDHPTGTVEVRFNDGEPDYDIVDGVAYDYIDAARLPELQGRWLLYHGSLALRHAVSASALAELTQRSAGARMVDINLRPPWWKREEILALVEGAYWVKLNDDELADIYPQLPDQDERVAHLSAAVSKAIVLTGGESGATSISAVDAAACTVVPEKAAEVVDTVGAGDAFCSLFLVGQLLAWPLELTMQRAQAFASAVVGIRGATTNKREFYEPFMREWGIKDHCDE